MSISEKTFNIIVSTICVIICILTFYPLWYTFIASISGPYFVETGSVIFWPHGINFDSYRRVFEIDGIWLAYGNTIFYTVIGTAVSMFLSTTMAYSLSRAQLKGRKFFTFLLVFTMWFNAGIIPTYLNLRDLGLLNTRSVIILGFALSAYNVIILKSFFEQVPISLEEAAFIDGANNLTVFARIFLPLSKPALATVGMFYAVGRWNGYFWAMTTLRDDEKMPLQVLLKKLIVEQDATADVAQKLTETTLSSSTTVIYAVIIFAIVPMLIVYPFIQKYFKTGMTIGAVKG